MTEIKYCVGVDMASSTFTAAVGEMPWKVFLKPQTFENTEDGHQQLLDWLAQHHLPISQTVVCMEAIVRDKLTVFLVEQNAYHALKLAHRGYVMVNGLITMAGSGRELLERPEVRAAYLEGGRH